MAKKRGRDQVSKHQQTFLSQQEDHPISKKKKPRPPKQHQQEEKFISTKSSRKILKEAVLQQKEIEKEEAINKDDPFININEQTKNVDLTDTDTDDDNDVDNFTGFSETQSHYENYNEEVDEAEERILEQFMSNDVGPQRTLADMIISRIKEKDEQVSSEARPLPKMDTAIIDLYKGVGKLLSKYTSGKLPKAFKHIPHVKGWEEVLYLTEPEKWSANAMFQATRMFASNFPPREAKRFYNLVLLPRIREDIRKNKRLHFALFQALRKSLFKIAAFNKGILFPLCESGTCNLREAVIIGSVIQKNSISPLHAGAALCTLADMEYCGTTSYFIKILLDKKYALPYRVLDAVVAHFMRFLDDQRVMPVIWHQSLLTFVQRYKNEITKEDKDNLDCLLQHQKHYLVTSEIKRELKNSRNRGEKEDPMSINILVSMLILF
ncbi:hypothetical protein IFM89_035464 [Coptis chinensis]|uniref:Bystin n=1 Tax=Coptis chinensis TaxID=261450 RepID=A0A835GZJ4_9MAGN|nr:hypothetical protein IFM89_035464 [Coptis chinensis]